MVSERVQRLYVALSYEVPTYTCFYHWVSHNEPCIIVVYQI